MVIVYSVSPSVSHIVLNMLSPRGNMMVFLVNSLNNVWKLLMGLNISFLVEHSPNQVQVPGVYPQQCKNKIL